MTTAIINSLEKDQVNQLLMNIRKDTHRLIIYLLMDAGLRVTECVTLKVGNFDFKRQILNVKSLKRRTEETYRAIPISQRLFNELADYLHNHKSYVNNPDNWLFPSPIKKGEHLNRFAVNKFLSRYNLKHRISEKLHPHQLRHTFGVQHIASGTPLEQVKTMLGHKSYDTTLIYAKVPQTVLRASIENVTGEKPSLVKRASNKLGLFKPKKRILNVSWSKDQDLIVGRSQEVERLESYCTRGIHTLVLGGIGVGKSTLLSSLNLSEKKSLKLDDMSGIKKSLVSMLLYLYKNDGDRVKELIFGNYNLETLAPRLQRESSAGLCDFIKQACEPNEYLLVIDSIDRITPAGVLVLESLKEHFTIVCCAREIAVNKSSFLWSFQTIALDNLSRRESLNLIDRISYDLEIEDWDTYRTHLFEQSAGNPRVIREMVDRYRREPVLSTNVIRGITHFGSLKELDFTWLLLAMLGAMTILRYLSREVENSNFRFIGGVALVVLLFAKGFTRFTKRKYFKRG